MHDFPKAGDIITIDFGPQRGHEIKKHRPALVVSNDAFNRLTGLVMVCPITSTHRDFPLHIPLDDRTRTHGDILCEQLKSLDYAARHWRFAETAPDDIFDGVLDIVEAILGK